VQNRLNHEVGIAYPTLVNAARALIPGNVTQIFHKVGDIGTGPVTQKITTSSGETFVVRLVILATGLSNNLRQNLGIRRDNLSKCHSISIGFDVASNDPSGFEFEALTYFTEDIASRMGYLTLFPIGSAMRANLFIYRDRDDGWLDAFRAAPQRALFESMPRLHRMIGDFSLASDVRVRPIDLYRTSGHQQSGVAIVGDSFATSCPAAGTGVHKVLVDVERLCNVYIPQWLATTGMGADKIAAFYDDAEKVASDVYSESLAYYMRSLAVDAELRWRVRRWGWLMLDAGRGFLSQRRPLFPAAAAPATPSYY
jgi:2-polyprenyl-6-methoxyphenol hydroxylase-like FAD-dependent oxidoreductase